MQQASLLPFDFLQKNNLEQVIKIARARDYKMWRIDQVFTAGGESRLVKLGDVIDDLCKSSTPDMFEAGLLLSTEAKRSCGATAAQIASSHSLPELQKIILKYIDKRKYLATITPLIQEAVLKGANFEQNARIRDFWSKRNGISDDLKWLPLHLTQMEENKIAPNKQPLKQTVKHSQNLFTFKSLPDQNTNAWNNYLYGKSLVRFFQSNKPMAVSDMAPYNLIRLPLACLKGATLRKTLVGQITPGRAYLSLFHATPSSTSNGAFQDNSSKRLAAWQSIRHLTDCSERASFAEVQQQAGLCRWYSFSSDSPWFYHIAWDTGLICVHPDSKRFCVLAATDED